MKSLLKKSLENAKLSIFIQVVIRSITLISNGYVAPIAGEEAMGIINVRLTLLEVLLLLFSREAIRRACLQNVKNHNWRKVVNFLWMIFPVSLLLSALLGYAWIHFLDPPHLELYEQYVVGVWVMCLSCIIEGCGETPNLLTKAFFFNNLRMTMSMIYLIVRTTLFVVLVVQYPKMAIHAFSAAHFLAIITWTSGYYTYFYFYLPNNASRDFKGGENFNFKSIGDLLPNFPLFNLPFDLVKLSASLSGMVIVRSLLQEGERYVMTMTGVLTLSQQGAYDLVTNLGSMPMKLLIKPLEDPLYFYIAQIFKRGGHARDIVGKQQVEASRLLYYVLRCSVCIGLTIIAFGMMYAPFVLTLYAGGSDTDPDGPKLLRAHGLMFLLIAVLTIAESFTMATLTRMQLIQYNILLGVLSVCYLCCAWVFTALLGPLGFIFACCVITTIRVAYSLFVMSDHFKGCTLQPLWGLVPSAKTILIVMINIAITSTTRVALGDTYFWTHLSIGSSCLLLTGLAFLYEEPNVTSVLSGQIYSYTPAANNLPSIFPYKL